MVHRHISRPNTHTRKIKTSKINKKKDIPRSTPVTLVWMPSIKLGFASYMVVSVCVCAGGGAHTHMCGGWITTFRLVFSFRCMNPGDRTQTAKFGDKSLYALSPLTCPILQATEIQGLGRSSAAEADAWNERQFRTYDS